MNIIQVCCLLILHRIQFNARVTYITWEMMTLTMIRATYEDVNDVFLRHDQMASITIVLLLVQAFASILQSRQHFPWKTHVLVSQSRSSSASRFDRSFPYTASRQVFMFFIWLSPPWHLRDQTQFRAAHRRASTQKSVEVGSSDCKLDASIRGRLIIFHIDTGWTQSIAQNSL